MTVVAMEPDLAQYAIPGVLEFARTETGLIFATIQTPAAKATVFLQGAHLTDWQPAGHQPVLFLSPQSEFAAGKAIRGGVPIVFPWFAADAKADRVNGKPGPSHGFARTQEWTLAFAAMVGEDVSLLFTLGPTEISRKLGFDRFRLALQLTIGATLTMSLTVRNESDALAPLIFEEAFHSYFAVSDVRQVTVRGLEATPFVDKTDHFALKPATQAPLLFPDFTDRVYSGTTAASVLEDPAAKRRTVIEKMHSQTTVIFNPQKALPDLAEEAWQQMLCIETANVAEAAITLAPGATHTMQARITVEAR